MDVHYNRANDIVRSTKDKLAETRRHTPSSFFQHHRYVLGQLQSDISEYINHVNAIIDAARSEMEPDIDSCFTPIRDWLERFAADVESCKNDKAATITACKALVGTFPNVDDGPRIPSSETMEKVRRSRSTTLYLLDAVREYDGNYTKMMQGINIVVRSLKEMRTILRKMEQSLHECFRVYDRFMDDVDALKQSSTSIDTHVDTVKDDPHVDTHVDTVKDDPHVDPHVDTVDVDPHVDTHVDTVDVDPHVDPHVDTVDVDPHVDPHVDTVDVDPHVDPHVDTVDVDPHVDTVDDHFAADRANAISRSRCIACNGYYYGGCCRRQNFSYTRRRRRSSSPIQQRK